MDVSAIAGSALLMKAARTQNEISISLIKMAAQQQDSMVKLLAQGIQQAAPKVDNEYAFSVYA